MVAAMHVKVTLRGPLFTKATVAVVKKAVTEEAIDVLTGRIMMTGRRFAVTGIVPVSKRGKRAGRQMRGKGLGVMRNALTEARGEMKATVDSTLIAPRVKGTAWAKYNMAIARSLVPRVANKTASRIVAELSHD